MSEKILYTAARIWTRRNRDPIVKIEFLDFPTFGAPPDVSVVYHQDVHGFQVIFRGD